MDAGADEAVAFVQINDKDEVRETLQQVALKFFLLPQGLFHGAPLGDVHQRALITDNLPLRVPHRP